jgi:hypothetical protein
MSIKKKLDDAAVDPHDQKHIMDTAKCMFSDSKKVWPLQSSMYFLGQIPKVEPPIATSIHYQPHQSLKADT